MSDVYVYLDGDYLKQCENYELLIRPLVNVSNLLDLHDEKRTYKQSILLFNEPKPPQSFKIAKTDEKSTILEWEHLKCYDKYEITVQIDGNSTVLLQEMVSVMDNGDVMTFEMEPLKPCMAYTFFIKSQAKDVMSKDKTAFVHFTNHADVIELKAWAHFYDLTVEVGLHGIDCVSHYKLFLCQKNAKICFDQIVEKKGNITFNELEDGQLYTYQLIGYDDDEKEMYTTEIFDIETQLNVTTKFEMSDVTNTSVTLDFHSSVFDKFDEKELGSYSIVAICGKVMNQFSKVHLVTLRNLKPFTEYDCSGQFQFNDEFYDINGINIKTMQGIPQEPNDLTIDKLNANDAKIEWKAPKVLNGEIENYKIHAKKLCHSKDDDNAICFDLCTTSEFTIISSDKNEAILEKLLPWTNYEIKISGKYSKLYFVQLDFFH